MNTKTNPRKKIFILALVMVMVFSIIFTLPISVYAATNSAGTYVLHGVYDIGKGSVSGYLNNFVIQISTKNFYDDSNYNSQTKNNYSTYDWTYFKFYICAGDIASHTSFKLVRNGSVYFNNSLTGKDDCFLYQGSLPDGDYVLTYVGEYWANIVTKKTYTFTYNFTVDTTAPSVSLTSGGSNIASGSYTNKSIVFSASDAYSPCNIYYRSPGTSVYTSTTEGSKNVSAKSANNGLWHFYASDGYQSSDTYSVYLDTVDPVGKITTVNGTTILSGSYSNVPVKYTASDTYGISHLQIQTPELPIWTNYYSGNEAGGEAGWHYFRAIDKAGNISQLSKVYYDSILPVGTLYGGEVVKDSGSSTNSPYIRYEAADPHSGVAASYVKTPDSTTYKTYTSDINFTAEGTYSFYTVDNAGNQSLIYTITINRQIPNAQLYADGNAISNGTYTNANYISFESAEQCYVKMPGASSFVNYVSGTEFSKMGKYVFYGKDSAGNSTEEYMVIIDRTVKKVNISNLENDMTNGDVEISWINGDANAYAPIKSVTINDIPISNGSIVYTIETGKYSVKVVDEAGNKWETFFASNKNNVLTDTMVKEFFEVYDTKGDMFSFTTYKKALDFAIEREGTKVKISEWKNLVWDTGLPMDIKDSINAKNGTYFIYYKSGNPDELVAYFTTERLNEVIAEYAKDGIKDYFYWEKEPATAGPNENLYSYSANRNILAKEVMFGENIGVTVDGEAFVGSVYNTEGKHVMVISDSYGNTCEYNLSVIRTLPDLYYAIGEGEAVKVDLERAYYFKDGISISITDALDEMAMFNVYDENGDLIGSYSLGEFCTLTESGTYTAVSVNHMGESEEFKIVISRNAPTVDLKADEAEKQLVITVTKSADDESHFQTLEVYKSTDGGETWNLLEIDDYGTAVELNNLVYKFRTSGMYKIVITDEFRTGMDAITGQITYTQPAPTGDLEGVTNGGHTNKEVTFTWEDEAKVTVTKDGEVIEYKSGDKLTDDGEYTITFENFDGAKTSYEFVIDTESVAIAAEGNKANLPVANPVIVHITEKDANAVLIKDGKEVGTYVSETAVSDEGDYIVRVTDEAGNVSEIAFEIDKSVDFAINVNDGGLSNSVVIEAKEHLKLLMIKNGEAMEYKFGTEILDPGVYTVNMVDPLGNSKRLSFTIVNALYCRFEQEIDEMPGFEKVIVNGEEVTLEKGTLIFTATGTYEVSIIANGNEQKFTVVVDSTAPVVTIEGVENGGTTKGAVILSDLCSDATMKVYLDDVLVEYNLGDELTDVGVYRIVLEDAAGNVSEYSFEILWKMPAVAIVLIVIAALGVVGTVVWLVISKKRKDEYYN